MKRKLLILPWVLFVMSYSSAAFSAFEGLSMMRMGDWEVDFSGNVNSFYTFVDCDSSLLLSSSDENLPGESVPIAAGLACGSKVGGDYKVNDVRTGLLPAWLNFYARTETKTGIQTAVHLSFQPGVGTGNGGNFSSALGGNSANFRQVFLTFGNDEIGTFKIGRDLGVFGSDAILNDMTLLGVGTVSDGTVGDARTSLGRIGVGYLYADWKAQLQYRSPDYDGFSFTVAVVDPWAIGSAYYDRAVFYINLQQTQERNTPGFEGKINYGYEFSEDSSVDLWAGFIYQKVDFEGAMNDLDTSGFDLGGKLSWGPFDLVGYYYEGDGIGTTGFLLDGLGISSTTIDVGGDFDIILAGEIEKRDSDGFYVQGMVTLPQTGTKLGLSYGESNLDLVEGEENMRRITTRGDIDFNPEATDVFNRTLVKTNSSWVVGIYQPLGEALNLVAEYTSTESEAHNGSKADEDSFALGAIMFF